MQKVLTAAEMREVDRLTTERYGIPSILLMENAAHAVARVITDKLGGSVKGKSILVLCGKGNNGGDGAALARILWEQAADVYLILIGQINDIKGDAAINFQFLPKLHEHDPEFIDFWETRDFREFHELKEGFLERQGIDLIVDALFGTGLMRPLEEPYASVARSISNWISRRIKVPVVSVDLPSGLNADLHEKIGPTVVSDATVTFTAPKLANIMPPAARLNGTLTVAQIGSPPELIDNSESHTYLAERRDVEYWLRRSNFSDDSYKNRRGHCLIVAGSEQFSGAAVLVGDAAMRSGVGLVTIATPKSSKESITARVLPEVMVRGVGETQTGAVAEEAYDELADLLEKANAVAVGSGLSQSDSTRKFVQKLIENRRTPVVIDADALNLLSPFRGEALQKPARSKGIANKQLPLILTPHEGEFMRLLGTDDKEVLKDRVSAVRNFSREHNLILVLKGERVLIGEPGGKVVVNPTGNSGLGKAGNGDTLTGIIAGFLTQAAVMNIDLFETVVAAVYVAGMAGDVAEKKYGKRVMTASDVRECLVEVFSSLGES